MRKLIILICAVSINTVLGQVKNCTTPEPEIVDINDLSIKKCSTEEKKTKKIRKVTKNKQRNRKHIANRFKNVKSKDASITVVNTTKKLKKARTRANNVLFSIVEEVPLFPKCKNDIRLKNAECFKTNINKHFAKNFYAERISSESIKERAIIQFTIEVSGSITGIKVLTKSSNIKLENEIKRILKLLPAFSPGKEQGIPVNVTYSFPLDLTLD